MAKWARSIVDIEEILVFNVVGFMLRTGFEDGCYEHVPPDKSREDNQWIKLKECCLRNLFPHRKRLFNFLFSWHVASKQWWAPHCSLFHKLRCTITPCLSTWLHLRFSQYHMKILSVVVSIVFCHQDYIIFNKVHALSLTDRYPVRRTARNLWHKHELEGAVYSPNLSFRKSIPRAINSPLPSRN